MPERSPREAAKYQACQIGGRSYYTSKDTRPTWYRDGFDKGWDAALFALSELTPLADREIVTLRMSVRTEES